MRPRVMVRRRNHLCLGHVAEVRSYSLCSIDATVSLLVMFECLQKYTNGYRRGKTHKKSYWVICLLLGIQKWSQWMLTPLGGQTVVKQKRVGQAQQRREDFVAGGCVWVQLLVVFNWLYKMQKNSLGKCNTFASVHLFQHNCVSFYIIVVHTLIFEMGHNLVFMHCKTFVIHCCSAYTDIMALCHRILNHRQQK